MTANAPSIPGAAGRVIPGGPGRIPGQPGGYPTSPGSDITPAVLAAGLRAGPVSIQWHGLLELESGMSRYGDALHESRRATAEWLAQEMETWAKAHAPWKDRTGDAREGLHGWAEDEDSSHRSYAYLSHGVDYGVFLETMQGGTLAIILPTILHFQNLVGPMEADQATAAYYSGSHRVLSSLVGVNIVGRLYNRATGRFVRRGP